MTYLFNNCRNRDYSRYGEGAFFDLGPHGRQATMAKGVRPGETCIVARYGDAGELVFGWHDFAHEKRMLDEEGRLVRVLFGRRTKSMAMAKAAAARLEPYAHLFDRNGRFKIVSAVRVEWPPRRDEGAWAFPEWGKARARPSPDPVS